MQTRVRVRRERPAMTARALAMAVTMLAVYLITLSAPREEMPASGARVQREMTLEGVTVYFADMGVYADAASARLAAAMLVPQGAAGVCLRDERGVHLLGDAYGEEGDALRIVRRLNRRAGMKAEVLKRTAPPVRLCIRASERDIRALADADRTLRTHLHQLGEMAAQVDRGELTPSSARTLAKVSRSEVRRAEEALLQVEGGEKSPVCRGLCRQLTDLSRRLQELIGEETSGAALSGRLRSVRAAGILSLTDFLGGRFDG